MVYSIAIHGGAGDLPRATLSAERERLYRTGLEAALDGGYAVLERGGTSLDAVAAAVRLLEDHPSFNAGHGAALTHDGAAELDAAIMDGRQLRAGAVASVRHVKNPIDLARRVMEKSRHVLLVGAGAEEFALEEHFTLVPNQYYRTAERLEQLESEQRGERVSDLVPPTPHGTVGAVACDASGNLAAATSTGGTLNKAPGRVGDSSLIGCGCYADNLSAAVSLTGWGEPIMKLVLGKWAVDRVLAGDAPDVAAQAAIAYLFRRLGGHGGIILLGPDGRYGLAHNTPRMAWGVGNQRGIQVGIKA
jgi:beta-aspartyl-peptidase (threonine type)